MFEKHNSNLTRNSQTLRKNMTRQERHLWYDFLKTLPVTVHRQKIFGNYIVDFYCNEAKTAIELDGSQHYEPEEQKKDAQRDEYFAALGIKVLRYTNLEIDRSFEAVCADIYREIVGEE